jgi:sigma-B regulation protein RsbU (phosphoserine phosphatase)
VELFDKHSTHLSRDELERDLHLRQLQLRSLLTITQAINDNVSATGLFDMYKNFLAWEMGVKKMALFSISDEDQWDCVVTINVDYSLDDEVIIENLLEYNRLHTITEEDHPHLKEFDILIPVYHKNDAIAFTLIGGFEDEKNLYNKIQFITTITNIISVAIENKRLFKKQLRQERLQKEIELAEEVQQMLIPDHLPKEEQFNIASIYKPHFNVGGDYFDYIPVDDHRFVICIADISGKGVGAAILMANFQAILRVVIRKSNDMTQLVQELNTNVYEITKSDKFITFFIALIDLDKQEIQYINAGHNPPMLVEEQKITDLDRGCTVLGAVPQLPAIDVGTYHFTESVMLISYTDGLTDLKNDEQEYFDRKKLEAFIREHSRMSAEQFNRRLQQHLEQFRGNQVYPDDIAILTSQLHPKRKKVTEVL